MKPIPMTEKKKRNVVYVYFIASTTGKERKKVIDPETEKKRERGHFISVVRHLV